MHLPPCGRGGDQGCHRHGHVAGCEGLGHLELRGPRRCLPQGGRSVRGQIPRGAQRQHHAEHGQDGARDGHRQHGDLRLLPLRCAQRGANLRHAAAVPLRSAGVLESERVPTTGRLRVCGRALQLLRAGRQSGRHSGARGPARFSSLCLCLGLSDRTVHCSAARPSVIRRL